MPVKERYYVEYWKWGTPPADIRAGEFATNNLKHCVKLILSGNKRNIVYLKRLSDGKVIWDRK
jgi:hypothetical protein